MDPSIMKLLEEDEDESMHSGADVEAFTAALNRDIEGGSSSSQLSQSDTSVLSQENNQTSSQMYSQWQPSSQDENSGNQCQQQDLRHNEHKEQQSSEMNMNEHGSGVEIKQEINGSQVPSGLPLQYKPMQVDIQGHKVEQNPGDFSQSSTTMQMQVSGTVHAHIHENDRMLNPGNNSHFANTQRFSNQPEQANRAKQIPFGSLLPIILPELDKDRAMQLQTLYAKLRRNEIPKEGFVRLMRNIVGDQHLRLAVVKMQAKSQSSVQQQQHPRPPAGTTSQFSDPYSFGQLHQKTVNVPARSAASVMQPQKDTHGMQTTQISDHSPISIQGLSKQQQQHLHFPQNSFSMYGATTYHPYVGTNVNTPSTMVKSQPHDPQMRQVQLHQGFEGMSHSMNTMHVPKVERQNSFDDPKRVPNTTISNMSSATSMQHDSVHWQSVVEQAKPVPGTSSDELSGKQHSGMGFPSTRIPTIASSSSSSSHMTTTSEADFQVGSQNTSGSSMSGIAGNAKSAAKKPSSGQKKPLDAHVSSPPMQSKKQKVSGGFSDQSIEHLNDVTAVSGVNLREEEEQLFSGPKDDTRVSEASRKAVQDEEDRLILQKIPLQNKLAEIIAKCGLKNLSNDVERCLSLCVEERLRGLLSSLIRVSKQRVDSEKSRHNTVITTDVREQILAINRKAREEWEKKQADAEKLRKQNEPESSAGVDVDKDKDEGRSNSVKLNREEDDKMKATAANVAARAAFGGDDVLSKWQLMAQARQKREGGPTQTTASSSGKDGNKALLATTSNSIGKVRDTNIGGAAGEKDQSTALSGSGAVRQLGRGQVKEAPPRVARRISVKDVIAVLEREPQMAKSVIICRLHERMRATE